jgi:hypothetical protein
MDDITVSLSSMDLKCRLVHQVLTESNIVLELLGSAHEHKGCGIGALLVQWGCDCADEEDVEIFVETNKAVLPLT